MGTKLPPIVKAVREVCLEEQLQHALVPVTLKCKSWLRTRRSGSKDEVTLNIMANQCGTVDDLKNHIYLSKRVTGRLYFNEKCLEMCGKQQLYKLEIKKGAEIELVMDASLKECLERATITVQLVLEEKEIAVSIQERRPKFSVEELKHMLQDEYSLIVEDIQILMDDTILSDSRQLSLNDLLTRENKLQIKVTSRGNVCIRRCSPEEAGWREEHHLDGVLNQQGLTLLIETEFIRCWRRILRMLDVNEQDIDCARQAYPHDPKEQAYQTLLKWTQQQGKYATWRKICWALEKLEKTKLVEVANELAMIPENSTYFCSKPSTRVKLPIQETSDSGEPLLSLRKSNVAPHRTFKSSSPVVANQKQDLANIADLPDLHKKNVGCLLRKPSPTDKSPSLHSSPTVVAKKSHAQASSPKLPAIRTSGNSVACPGQAKVKVTKQPQISQDDRLLTTSDLPDISNLNNLYIAGPDQMKTWATKVTKQPRISQADRKLTMNDLPDISNFVHSIAKNETHTATNANCKIYNLGIQLRLNPGKVTKLQQLANDPNDFLHQVITSWLMNESRANNQTWRALIEALYSKSVGEENLAKIVAKDNDLQHLIEAMASSRSKYMPKFPLPPCMNFF